MRVAAKTGKGRKRTAGSAPQRAVADTSDPPSVVASYLQALNDPAALIDEQQVARLERELAEERSDYLRRLELRTELRRAQVPPLDELERAFVTVAKAWADEHGIAAEAFRLEGVPANVLSKAGFRLPASATTPARQRPPGEHRQRIPLGAVLAAAEQLPVLTTRSLQAASGCSEKPARKAIRRLWDEGRITERRTSSGARVWPRAYVWVDADEGTGA